MAKWLNHQGVFLIVVVLVLLAGMWFDLMNWLSVETIAGGSAAVMVVGWGFAVVGFDEQTKELRRLERYRDFLDRTFHYPDERKAAVCKELARLANLAAAASQKVIDLQKGGLKAAGMYSEEIDAEATFNLIYESANSNFRDAQLHFHHYLDLVTPYTRDIGVNLPGRNFRDYLHYFYKPTREDQPSNT